MTAGAMMRRLGRDKNALFCFTAAAMFDISPENRIKMHNNCG